MLLPLEPPMFAELIERMRLARRPRHLARELGIMGHPSLQELDGRRGFRRGMKRYIWMQQVRDVIYRLDSHTQHLQAADARKHDTAHKAKVRRRKQKLDHSRGLDYHAIVDRALHDHLGQLQKSSGNDQRLMFSVPVDWLEQNCLGPVSSYLTTPVGQRPPTLQKFSMASDVDDANDYAHLSHVPCHDKDRRIYFKIVEDYPCRSHLVSVEAGAGRKIGVNAFAITMHRYFGDVDCDDDDGPNIMVETAPHRVGAISPVVLLDTDLLHMSGILMWRQKTSLECTLSDSACEGFDGCTISKVCSGLLRSGALPKASGVYVLENYRRFAYPRHNFAEQRCPGELP
eukprot:4308135-Pyramimonas_sp.AAC.1